MDSKRIACAFCLALGFVLGAGVISFLSVREIDRLHAFIDDQEETIVGQARSIINGCI